MTKKGFTLIELLAVIVILAIIALIATPVVLNIISDAKDRAGLSSANFYLDALELSIAQSVLKEDNVKDGIYDILNGNLCLDNTCTKKLEVEVKGEVPATGSIAITNGQIGDLSLNINDRVIGKKNGELVYLNILEDICELIEYSDVTKISAGDKYECRVKAGTKYIFYILTEPEADDLYANLIMDRNMCSDGTPTSVENQNKCLVEYNSFGETKDVGPVTAMEYLNNATSLWSNIPNLNVTYDDEGKNFTEFKIMGKARMPYYSEVLKFDATKNNAFLYENLNGDFWSDGGLKPTNNISGIYGYWTLSSDSENSKHAYYVGSDGIIYSDSVNKSNHYGVRPVISLKI